MYNVNVRNLHSYLLCVTALVWLLYIDVTLFCCLLGQVVLKKVILFSLSLFTWPKREYWLKFTDYMWWWSTLRCLLQVPWSHMSNFQVLIHSKNHICMGNRFSSLVCIGELYVNLLRTSNENQLSGYSRLWLFFMLLEKMICKSMFIIQLFDT